MRPQDDNTPASADDNLDEQAISEAFQEMEVLYKSRCIQNPLGSNVVVREIPNDDER